ASVLARIVPSRALGMIVIRILSSLRGHERRRPLIAPLGAYSVTAPLRFDDIDGVCRPSLGRGSPTPSPPRAGPGRGVCRGAAPCRACDEAAATAAARGAPNGTRER